MAGATTEFQELIRRAREGDQAAATALVRQVQPDLERYVQSQLNQLRLSPVLDATDICQTVLYRFFLGLTGGRFGLDAPDQLQRLTTTMARNQVLDEARKHRTQRRDLRRRVLPLDCDPLGRVADPSPTPSRMAAGQELVQEMYRRLTADERDLAEQRRHGHQWAEIAAARGDNAAALRKKLSRALERVTKELGINGQPPAEG
jgi:DNA-directed RNA polymerase specialized sigma24 family protein